ncbi:sugar transporter [Pseudoroseicyclus aestuarii]|uniref:Pantothenate kinase n=1 Tax=Pseudoroseicyclus aestuarii TaxID=1795041 RepID=A0A318SVS6_9RHOB|nr:sugar transporter [Pseudoroseicyclus aestuarii]PYE86011.1 pantothenate kinase [Pseudoroseicyclus aestuarii]
MQSDGGNEGKVLDLTEQVEALTERVEALRTQQHRILVAIAGAPASGKTTLAAELAKRLRLKKCQAEVVPMDGFHLDNAVLDMWGMRTRKGAPESFDAGGFLHLIRRLAAEEDVVAPIFDRARDIAIAGAQVVPSDCPVVIVEGNYLLHDEAPWSRLAPLWHVSAFLEVPIEDIRARLIQRWLSLGHTRAVATQRVMHNDMPNAQRVMDHALPADLRLRPPQPRNLL